MSENGDLKVIYVLGFARSGTTILSNILGEIDGFFHVGELHYLWSRLASGRKRCGCRSFLEDCPLWSKVVVDTYEALSSKGSKSKGPFEDKDKNSFVHQALQLRNRSCNTSRGGEWLKYGRRLREVKEYAYLMEHLFHNVARVTGARVILDSSKLLEPAYIFKYMPSISPHYIHVVRDSRGSVLSRQRKHARLVDGKFHLSPFMSVADSLRWAWSNRMFSEFGDSNWGNRYSRINYETFATQPEVTLRELTGFVGEPQARLPFLNEKTVMLKPNHTVCGNLNRFNTGEVTLRVDNRWMDTMRKRDLILVTALTSPLLLKYGYSLWPFEARNSESQNRDK